ncbi:dienelactone hydrolase family protein [uncultured Sunxiuqinia sp.]|uniref:carboxylesterase family protein n=1 Tax=uncultured Sunxiuqinia sp. TaxID=1573825 RepID=UPI002AA834B3|nr:dienelactone hydrolase family protein [uncultured Sunxiuqinia sp.]
MKIAISLLIVLFYVGTSSCNSQTVDKMIEKETSEPGVTDFLVNGGYHQPFYLDKTSSPYGYYFFTPSSSLNSDEKYPLLIFLHGYGERGNSKTTPTDLEKVLKHGPPKMIKNGTWKPSVEMFVASPQCHGDWWNRDLVKQFVEYLMDSNNQIDTSRIYLTGISMGGFATFDLLCSFGEASHIAAAVPICGKGELSDEGNENLSKIPLWVFHGDADGTVSPEYSKTIVPMINELNPPVPAKLTIYPGVGHDSWTVTYSGSGMGRKDTTYDVFDIDIYTWMNQFKKQ